MLRESKQDEINLINCMFTKKLEEFINFKIKSDTGSRLTFWMKGCIFLQKLSLVVAYLEQYNLIKEKMDFIFGLITITDWAKPIVSGRIVISALVYDH